MNGLFGISSNIDWSMLREQKLTLLKLLDDEHLSTKQKEDIQGVIHLIDDVQDNAVDSGIWDKKQIFSIYDYQDVIAMLEELDPTDFLVEEGDNLNLDSEECLVILDKLELVLSNCKTRNEGLDAIQKEIIRYITEFEQDLTMYENEFRR